MALEGLLNISDPHAKAVWTRMGIQSADAYWGAPKTKARELGKRLKKDHTLALQLWAQPIHDAKLLSCFLEEPKKITALQMLTQSHEIPFHDIGDTYAECVAATSPLSYDLLDGWMNEREAPFAQQVRRLGWTTLYFLAKRSETLDHTFFEPYIPIIAEMLHSEENWVRESMNNALIGIGKRYPELHSQCVEVAHSLGDVVIDYGTTSCKIVDARVALIKKSEMAEAIQA